MSNVPHLPPPPETDHHGITHKPLQNPDRD